ncbi:MAG: hypothetical protein ACI9F9_002752 [Candidatus Paceibacteria bacterium]|jgi:hypothetical protein
MAGQRFFLLGSLSLATLVGPSLVPPTTRHPGGLVSDFSREVVPFLKKHCYSCHGGGKHKGGLKLDQLNEDFSDPAGVDEWLEVVEQLGTGQMPPEEELNRPLPIESGRIASLLSTWIAEGSAARLARRAEVSFQRLTRVEYAATIKDLLGVQYDASDASGLNEEEQWRGFDRIGQALYLSPSHIEKYLTAAEAVLDEAYPESPATPHSEHLSAIDLLGGPATFGQERFAKIEANGRANQIRIDLWPGQELRLKVNGGQHQPAGTYRFRLQASGLRPNEGLAPHLSVHATSIDRLLFAQDIVIDEDAPTTIEFEAHLPAGTHELLITNATRGPSVLKRVGRAGNKPFFSLAEGRVPWQVLLKDEQDAPLHPLLILDWLESEGPLENPLRELRESFMPQPSEAGFDKQAVRAVLTRFAERAFRRPPATEEIDGLLSLVEAELAAGVDIKNSVKASMLAVLCSKSFLYLREGSEGQQSLKLDAWELASRLSYFLWNSLPDAQLIDLARNGSLLQAAVLRSEFQRMLEDPKAMRFMESFPRQWLQLDEVGQFAPNVELYPDYDLNLERSMVLESTEFFRTVLEENLPLSEFLASDWTMLNERLANHYGIAGVLGNSMRRVSLEPSHHRGGLMTHASVLSLSSDGTRHRPVHRGVWISETILGEFPPSPPASVEPIEPTPIDAAKATVREQLDAHKQNPSCFACHRKIDPLGFAFDNYDAVGSWRTEEKIPTGTGANPPVDASGVLPDGRSFTGVAEFQILLVADVDVFAAAFIKKLSTYALRRPMSADDQVELDRILQNSAADRFRMKQIFEFLVLSDLFKSR